MSLAACGGANDTGLATTERTKGNETPLRTRGRNGFQGGTAIILKVRRNSA